FDLMPGDPQEYYEKGIRLDMERWKVEEEAIEEFLKQSAGILEGEKEEHYEQIGTQSWIGFVPNYQEAWTYIRGTGDTIIPVRTESYLDKGETDGVLPRRFLYPATEYSGNRNSVEEAAKNIGGDAIDTPVWWDVRD